MVNESIIDISYVLADNMAYKKKGGDEIIQEA